MKRSILIGLGGAGSRIVNCVAERIHNEKLIGDEIKTVCAVMDTDLNELKHIKWSKTNLVTVQLSEQKTIGECLRMHKDMNPERWCTVTPFMAYSSLLDGTGGSRIRSRIAFMDVIDSPKIEKLTQEFEKMLSDYDNNDPAIQIEIVSSLAGGTGSGMFIQVALWLHKFFKGKARIMLRGVFLLPDDFLSIFEHMNPQTKLYHYANTYAAIRELNAIDNAIKNPEKAKKAAPIIIDGLFDSHHIDIHILFSAVFLIDGANNGKRFNSLDEYDEMVADTVYLQLYSPMSTQLSRIEDAYYYHINRCDFKFASVGVSKAVYPKADIQEYCVLRAVQETLGNEEYGWGRIDKAIQAGRSVQETTSKEEGPANGAVDIAEEYVRLFDEWLASEGVQEMTEDSFLGRLKRDVNEVEKKLKDGKVFEEYTCKAEAFYNRIVDEIMKEAAKAGEKVKAIMDDVPDENVHYSSEAIAKLRTLYSFGQESTLRVLSEIDAERLRTAHTMVDRIVPVLHDEDVDVDTVPLINQLLTKLDEEREVSQAVHPMAARYLLYKLTVLLQKELDNIEIPRKEDILSGKLNPITADNPKTHKKETFEEYFYQTGWYTSQREVAYFVKRYRAYNEENSKLCVKYCSESLKRAVISSLLTRVNRLVSAFERMFGSFVRIDGTDCGNLPATVEKKISDNIERNRNDNTTNRTLFVYAEKKHKEAIFDLLSFDVNANYPGIYQEIIEGVYQYMCDYESYGRRGGFTIDSERFLFDCLVRSYEPSIQSLGQIANRLDMDIVEAIAEECQYSGEPIDNALNEYKNALVAGANQFLLADDDVLFMGNFNHVDIWGLNLSVAMNNNGLFTNLFVGNALPLRDPACAKNEIWYYSSIYGIPPENIAKINELSEEAYYQSYQACVYYALNESWYVTPHIDKTWHWVLPYVTPDMCCKSQQEFYETLWKAIAYGQIVVKDGKYHFIEHVKTSNGEEDATTKQLVEEGQAVAADEVVRMIQALKSGDWLEFFAKPMLEETFQKDIDDHEDSVTVFVERLCSSGDQNPIAIMVRYLTSREGERVEFDEMKKALTRLLRRISIVDPRCETESDMEKVVADVIHRFFEKCSLPDKEIYFVDWA